MAWSIGICYELPFPVLLGKGEKKKKKGEIAYREKLGIRVVQTLFCLPPQPPLPPNLLPNTHSPSFLNISSSKTNHRA